MSNAAIVATVTMMDDAHMNAQIKCRGENALVT